jgi:hypothetical protein
LLLPPVHFQFVRSIAQIARRDDVVATASAATIEGSISSLGSQYVVRLKAVNCRSGGPRKHANDGGWYRKKQNRGPRIAWNADQFEAYHRHPPEDSNTPESLGES